MAKTTMRTLYKIECEPDCGFLLRDHDQDELADFGARHGRKAHSMKDVTAAVARTWIKPA